MCNVFAINLLMIETVKQLAAKAGQDDQANHVGQQQPGVELAEGRRVLGGIAHELERGEHDECQPGNRAQAGGELFQR